MYWVILIVGFFFFVNVFFRVLIVLRIIGIVIDCVWCKNVFVD